MSSTKKRAIIIISVATKSNSCINYSRRMYAIIRRYTPDAVEGQKNECFAELTGLRTFFKMTYKEMVDAIINDIKAEIGISCVADIATPLQFDRALAASKRPKNVSTYKEMNTLFAGHSLGAQEKKFVFTKKVRLTVPFLGKVA